MGTFELVGLFWVGIQTVLINWCAFLLSWIRGIYVILLARRNSLSNEVVTLSIAVDWISILIDDDNTWLSNSFFFDSQSTWQRHVCQDDVTGPNIGLTHHGEVFTAVISTKVLYHELSMNMSFSCPTTSNTSHGHQSCQNITMCPEMGVIGCVLHAMTTSSQNLLVIVFHVEEKQAFRNIY
jgi:hypothetical protein